MSTNQRCPECDARIESVNDVEFIEWDTEDTGLSFNAPKILYLVACVNCAAAIGGGVAGGQ